MKIGYARKSTHLQDVAHQVDELTKAGWSKSIRSDLT
jgi:DNA invertase Pin-like site-specific DNA recombinase